MLMRPHAMVNASRDLTCKCHCSSATHLQLSIDMTQFSLSLRCCAQQDLHTVLSTCQKTCPPLAITRPCFLYLVTWHEMALKRHSNLLEKSMHHPPQTNPSCKLYKVRGGGGRQNTSHARCTLGAHITGEKTLQWMTDGAKLHRVRSNLSLLVLRAGCRAMHEMLIAKQHIYGGATSTQWPAEPG